MRWRAIILVSILDLGLNGCFTAKKKLILPPPAPVVAKPAPQPQIEIPPDIDSPLSIAMEALTLEIPPQMETPPPKPVSRRKPLPTPVTPTPAPPVPVGPEAEPPQPVPPVPATPQLGEILTDDRRREYETDFNGKMSRAQEAVKRAASARRLSARQQETVQRIGTFLQQAEASKAKDLVTALELARRADLLGQDLLKSLQ